MKAIPPTDLDLQVNPHDRVGSILLPRYVETVGRVLAQREVVWAQGESRWRYEFTDKNYRTEFVRVIQWRWMNNRWVFAGETDA